MSTHRIVPLALLFAVLVSLLLGPATTALAAESGGQSCQRGTSRWNGASLADCPDGEGTKPKNEKKQQEKKQEQPGKKSEKKSPAGEGESPKKPYAGENPNDAPGQWAKAGAEGAQGMAKDLKDRIDSGELGKINGFWGGQMTTLYAVMWALGWLVAIVATMIAVTKMASGSLAGRELAQTAGLRLLLFAPISAAVPMIGLWLSDLAAGLGSGFFGVAQAEVSKSLEWVMGVLAGLTFSSMVIPGGSAVVVGLTLFLVAALGAIALELLAAKYIIALLLLFLPVLFAMSINPSWSAGVKKATGVLVGAWLTPAALFFVWAGTWQLVSGPLAPEDPLLRICTLLVGLLVSLAAPMAIGVVLSHVVPGFAGTLGVTDAASRGASGLFSKVKGVQSKGQDAIKQGGRHAGKSPSSGGPGRAQRASQASEIQAGQDAGGIGPGTTQKGAATTAGGSSSGGAASTGASSAGSAAAGPVGAAAQAWNKVRKGTERGAKAAQQQTAAATERASTAAGGDAGGGSGSSSGGSSGDSRSERAATAGTSQGTTGGSGPSGTTPSRPATSSPGSSPAQPGRRGPAMRPPSQGQPTARPIVPPRRGRGD